MLLVTVVLLLFNAESVLSDDFRGDLERLAVMKTDAKQCYGHMELCKILEGERSSAGPEPTTVRLRAKCFTDRATQSRGCSRTKKQTHWCRPTIRGLS